MVRFVMAAVALVLVATARMPVANANGEATDVHNSWSRVGKLCVEVPTSVFARDRLQAIHVIEAC
jgi:hypothetical protein